MPTKLEKLLCHVDPVRVENKISALVDLAINTFPRKSGSVQNQEEFQKILSEFHWHIQKTVLKTNLSQSPGLDIDWARCTHLLGDAYGPHGERIAFNMAYTGLEGGLYAVLKTLAKQMKEQYYINEIQFYVYQLLDSLSIEEQLAAADEYVEKYRHMLPVEYTKGNRAMIKAHFLKILTEHPKILKRFRQIQQHLR